MYVRNIIAWEYQYGHCGIMQKGSRTFQARTTHMPGNACIINLHHHKIWRLRWDRGNYVFILTAAWFWCTWVVLVRNWLFPCSIEPLFQHESFKTSLMKISFIYMKMNQLAEFIFVWMVLHLHLFWHWGSRQLGNGLFGFIFKFKKHWELVWMFFERSARYTCLCFDIIFVT